MLCHVVQPKITFFLSHIVTLTCMGFFPNESILFSSLPGIYKKTAIRVSPQISYAVAQLPVQCRAYLASLHQNDATRHVLAVQKLAFTIVWYGVHHVFSRTSNYMCGWCNVFVRDDIYCISHSGGNARGLGGGGGTTEEREMSK